MPCRFDGVVVPTDIRIPINVCVVAPVCVQATPPADAALPPIKLPLIVKLFPDAALFTLIPINPVVVFEKVLVAVWNILFPVIVQSVFPPTTNIPFAIVAIVMTLLSTQIDSLTISGFKLSDILIQVPYWYLFLKMQKEFFNKTWAISIFKGITVLLAGTFLYVVVLYLIFNVFKSSF